MAALFWLGVTRAVTLKLSGGRVYKRYINCSISKGLALESDIVLYVIRKKKAMLVLATLSRGSKGIREIQKAIGGSASTIQTRIEELTKVGLIAEKEVWDEKESAGEYVRSKRWLELTEKGRQLIEKLKTLDLWEEPLVSWDRQKWIILDLYSLGQVKGRTRLMKLLFLQPRELEFRKLGNFYKFRPGDFGPFSKEVLQDTEELQSNGILNVKLERLNVGIRWVYKLPLTGEDIARKLLDRMPRGTLEKLNALKPFNEMTLFELLKYVYSRYPKYALRSIIEWKEEYES